MHENIVRIKAVHAILQGLEQDYVFVGGATVSLYATDTSLTEEVRPTDDVDVIVELATYGGFAGLEEKLRDLGFQNDVASGVLCRYKIQGIIVDVMPTKPDVIGFSNKWYPEGFANAVEHRIDDQTIIKIFSLPYFIASKWEAFKGRGKGDYRTSKDFEDIVYVLENAENFEEQMKTAPQQLIDSLRDDLSKVVDLDDFEEGLYAHLSGGYHGADAKYIQARIKAVFGIDL